MGIFRSTDNEFLLCYDGELFLTVSMLNLYGPNCLHLIEFGLYVDRHGDPNRPMGLVEWEGTADRVAFHPPYILIFDSRFIEVRHISQGKLVQIIQGTDIHCTWDGRGNLSRQSGPSQVSSPGPGGWEESSNPGDAKIHGVMKSDKTGLLPGGGAGGATPRGAVAQHLFELTPTQPLYPTMALQQQQMLTALTPNSGNGMSYFGLQPPQQNLVVPRPNSSAPSLRSNRPSMASFSRPR